jgi:hypothetical protein
MRKNSATQMLSYPIRLPDPIQEEALCLLDLSRQVINATLVALWPRLDDFGTRASTYAYKQVTAMLAAPVFSGDRLWRCQAEQAGRILRSQAERKKQFALVLPLVSQAHDPTQDRAATCRQSAQGDQSRARRAAGAGQ